jgi:hypothetical protein
MTADGAYDMQRLMTVLRWVQNKPGSMSQSTIFQSEKIESVVDVFDETFERLSSTFALIEVTPRSFAFRFMRV